MKSHKDLEKHALGIIKRFQPKLLAQQYVYSVSFGKGAEFWECVFNYPYLNVDIHYSERAFKDWCGGKDVTPYVLHEMCHAITDPFYAKATDRYSSKNEIRDERERLTDLICNIVLGLSKKKV